MHKHECTGNSPFTTSDYSDLSKWLEEINNINADYSTMQKLTDNWTAITWVVEGKVFYSLSLINVLKFKFLHKILLQ